MPQNNKVQLPAGYEDAKPGGNTTAVTLPAGYEDALPKNVDVDTLNAGGAITPQPNETFAETMMRAAKAGQQVPQSTVDRSEASGKWKVPAALAAAPVVGAGGAAALAAAGEAVPEEGNFPAGRDPETGRMLPWKMEKTLGKMLQEHLRQPGTILKTPYGRAIEYYLLGKLGLSEGAIAKIGKHLGGE